MEQRVPFVRVLKLSRLLETFFISSVTSILVIRAFLASTGYPQLGGLGLHIAHLLWGGLLMLIVLVRYIHWYNFRRRVCRKGMAYARSSRLLL